MNDNKCYILNQCNNCSRSVPMINDLSHLIKNNLVELGLDSKLLKKLTNVKYHHLPKISISGCPNGCSQPQIKDFGVIGYHSPKVTNKNCNHCERCISSCIEQAIMKTKDSVTINYSSCMNCGDCIRVCPSETICSDQVGWRLLEGGRLGRHPKLAQEIGMTKDNYEVVNWIEYRLISYLKSKDSKRLSYFIEENS